LSKRLSTEVKVYRAFNKNHVFFTVFGKASEDRVNGELLQGAVEFEGEVTNNGNLEKKVFKMTTYAKYEAEVRSRVEEADRIIG
jgi:hypothetical protein